jgi:hypothetical protein
MNHTLFDLFEENLEKIVMPYVSRYPILPCSLSHMPNGTYFLSEVNAVWAVLRNRIRDPVPF